MHPGPALTERSRHTMTFEERSDFQLFRSSGHSKLNDAEVTSTTGSRTVGGFGRKNLTETVLNYTKVLQWFGKSCFTNDYHPP